MPTYFRSGHVAGRISSHDRTGAADAPGEQLRDPVDRVIREVSQHVPQVGFGIEPVQLGRAEKLSCSSLSGTRRSVLIAAHFLLGRRRIAGVLRSILRIGPLRYANLAHLVTVILPHPLGVGTPPTNGRRLGATNRLFLGFPSKKGFDFVFGMPPNYLDGASAAQSFFLLSTVRRKRNDSVPVSMMCARSVIRSNRPRLPRDGPGPANSSRIRPPSPSSGIPETPAGLQCAGQPGDAAGTCTRTAQPSATRLAGRLSSVRRRSFRLPSVSFQRAINNAGTIEWYLTCSRSTTFQRW